MKLLRNYLRDREKALILITSLVAIFAFIYFAGIGWTHTIQDHHGFRQTQTALSSYFMTKGSPFFLYETPVLGPPWSIPLEFPLFQALVGLISRTTHYPLEQTARLLNIILLLSLIWPISILFEALNIRRRWAFIFFSLLIISPNYQFWTRTFMIETLAMCLSFNYLAMIAKNMRPVRGTYALWVVGLGTLASMVKITTFFSFAVGAGIWLGMELLKSAKLKQWKLFSRKALINGFFGIATPLAIGFFLSKYYDRIRAQNPLASNFLTLDALHDWNFGTWQQKLDLNVWINFYNVHVKNSLGLPALMFAVLIVSLFLGKYGVLAWLCTGLFFINLIVFTNLYVVHDYYAYANSIFLIFALGFCLYGIRERLSWKLAFSSAVLCLFQLNAAYRRDYLPFQLTDNQRFARIGQLIHENTDKEDVLLIWGHDWAPEVPFVSKRYSIMDRQNRDVDDPTLKKSLSGLGHRNIGAVLFCDGAARPEFIADKPQRLGMNGTSADIDGCKIFLGKSSNSVRKPIF